MSSIAGWTPPSFHPDGTLTAAELVPLSKVVSASDNSNTKNTGQKYNRALTAAAAAAAMMGRVGGGGVMDSAGGTKEPPAAAAAKLPSEAATFQWGEKAPTCAVVFGGLNSMYVNPEVWLLPLRWVENTVQLFPPSADPDSQRTEKEDGNETNTRNDTIDGPGGIGFATAVRLKKTARVAAGTARGNVAANTGASSGSNSGRAAGAAAVAGVGAGDNAWRLFQAGGASAGKGNEKYRRASLPCDLAAGAAALGLGSGLDMLRPHQQQQQHRIESHLVSGVGGEVATIGREGDDDHRGMLEPDAEMEVSYGRMSVGVLLWRKFAEVHFKRDHAKSLFQRVYNRRVKRPVTCNALPSHQLPSLCLY